MSFLEKHSDEISILFDMLKKHVNDKFGVNIQTIDDIKVDSRKKPLVYFRKLIMVILGETFNKDYNQDKIAEVVGLDRTSFIYHSKIHLNDYTRYPKYKSEYDEIRDAFINKISI